MREKEEEPLSELGKIIVLTIVKKGIKIISYHSPWEILGDSIDGHEIKEVKDALKRLEHTHNALSLNPQYTFEDWSWKGNWYKPWNWKARKCAYEVKREKVVELYDRLQSTNA